MIKLSVDDLSVCALVCPVHCGKIADRIQMPFVIIGQTGLGMRHVVGFGIGPREGVLLAENFGHAIVTIGTLQCTCATVPLGGRLPKLLWAILFC